SGEDIVYTVKEDEVDKYTTEVSDLTDGIITVTNTHTPEKTSVEATKVWDDADNQDGIRTAVTFHLNKQVEGGEVTVVEGQDKTIALDAESLTVTWENLPAYEGGKKLTYTVTEDEIEGYTTEITGSMEDGYTVTNTHTPEETSVEATKVWDDADNQDGIRTTVTFHLNKQVEGGEVTVVEGQDKTIALDAESLTVTWENLPAYEGGKKLTYTVTEDEIEGYTTEITGSMEDGYTVTNTHTPELRNIEVSKNWVDNSNQDGMRPGSINVTLYNGEEKVDSAELNEGNGWKVVFTGVPKYQAGQIIEYKSSEDKVPEGYTESGGTMEVDANGNATITITNTHETEKISITVKKAWNDADNQDGVRPESVVVQLYANDNPYGEKETLDESNNWSHTYRDLDKKESGEDIVYTVKEDEVDKYTTEVSDLTDGIITVTNTHTPEKTSVKVSKVWNDSDNQDGIRPANVTIELYGTDLEKSLKTVILSESNKWSYEFTDLDKNAAGELINYTIKEVETDVITGEDTDSTYSYEITGSINDGFVVTNTHTPIEISLDVEKVWKDADNQDGFRPDDIKIELYSNGEKTDKTLTLSDENSWKGSFDRLPKNSNGQEIEYSINEVSVENYKVTISPITDGKITVTNEHTPNVIKIVGEKIWIDSDNQDGKRPENITVHLFADGKEIKSQEVKGSGNNWTYEFTDLQEYRAGKVGEKIDYTVTEDEVADYSTSIDKFTIKNTHEKETLEISGTKTWNDDNNRDNKRPDSITVHLLANGETIDTKTVTVGEDGSWTYNFGTHDKYKAGVIINYTITEDAVEGYSTAINNFDITNTHTPETITISGTKTWDDADNQDGKRTDDVTIILKADGEEIKRTTASESTNWGYEFTDLPKYKTGSVGQLINYTVSEVEVDGYETEITGSMEDGYTVTNSHTPELLSFTVTKNWEDYDNNDGIRPESITVRLSANGEEIKTYEISSENNWTYTFVELPRYCDGEEIEYIITEDEVDGYITTVSENVIVENDDQTITINNTITNTHEKEKITIEGVKTWEDFDNEYNSRPNEITIYLYKKDELYKTIIVTSETDWKYVIDNLDKYADGEEITYTIKEEAVEGYETTYDGYNILNKIIWNIGDGEEELPPQTGIEISFNNVLYVIISGVLFILGSYLKHEESK
ncbi:MAG: Cna B-type domain-containing protein, partial [Bacilli bacterium]|nr:Cna B-type domain-containing protein [Bacilli bacterium]